jgi:type II secretory pathway pseudopilin PulG
MNQSNLHGTRDKRGFSTLELLLVMVVTLVIAAFAIPGFNEVRRTLRISGDARNLNGAVNQAKLQAAADFTDARLYIDLGANNVNTFHVDIWNKAANCWQVVGDLLNPCYAPGRSPVQFLSQGVSFGFAGVGAPPPNTQAGGIAQGTGGQRCNPVNGRRVGQQAATACIQFNSRGTPIDGNGLPAGNVGGIYITDNTQVYGVTVGATGLSQVWANNVQGNANWYRK